MTRLTSILILYSLFGSQTARFAAQQAVSPEVQTLYAQARAAQAADRTAEAIADYQKILQLAPDLAPAYNNLGRLLYNRGQYLEAITVLKKGLTINPEMHPAEVMLGASYFQVGQIGEAVAPLQAGVQALPEDRFARMTLARTLIGLDRSKEALTQLNAILVTDPKDQEAWYLVGKLHLRLSEQAFTEVQTINPATPLAHELAGEIMESMQNTSGAIAAYKEAIAASPLNPGGLEHLADLYWHTGDWAQAQQTYRNLLIQQPANCGARWKLANASDEMGGAPADGLKELDTALSQCPALAQARAERARLLIRTGQPAQALTDLRAAEEAAPDEASLQQLFAQAYRAMGDRVHADAAVQRFQQLQAAEHAEKERHAASVIQANH